MVRCVAGASATIFGVLESAEQSLFTTAINGYPSTYEYRLLDALIINNFLGLEVAERCDICVLPWLQGVVFRHV